MSYILEALRKSEIERKQGEIPDLGASVQIIHKPRKQAPSVLTWVVAAALLANAALLAWLFWPGSVGMPAAQVPDVSPAQELVHSVPEAASQPASASIEAAPEPIPEARPSPVTTPTADEESTIADSRSAGETQALAPDVEPEAVQVPSESPPVLEVSLTVPTLGSMPADFQRRVPDLTFNSHIYSSSADARRIMINNEYLKEGARFSNMVVEEITEDGVILSLQGQSFAVSVVRNWNAPR